MTMDRQDVEEHVTEALSCPVLARRLQGVVNDIEEHVPGGRTKEMMYDLVDIVLQMGQRVRALETRVTGYDVHEDLGKRNAHQPMRRIDYGVDFPSERDHAKHRR